MVTTYLGIGSNLGQREGYIHRAIELLQTSPGIDVKRVSSLYETDPVGGPPQGKFLNGTLEIQTSLSPRDLLQRLKEIEKLTGRLARERYGPREIDLDILLYGDHQIQEPDLVIPHPEMWKRSFVLTPLKEIAPDLFTKIT